KYSCTYYHRDHYPTFHPKFQCFSTTAGNSLHRGDRYIVAAPEICHGKPTFSGTSIIVSQVPEQVASGMVREAIIAEWRIHVRQAGIEVGRKGVKDSKIIPLIPGSVQ
ncbi:MAG: DUF433 domain-containing protein, partial [bacterium]|nr:DUF433 domain-containing protein [bacterium]